MKCLCFNSCLRDVTGSECQWTRVATSRGCFSPSPLVACTSKILPSPSPSATCTLSPSAAIAATPFSLFRLYLRQYLREGGFKFKYFKVRLNFKDFYVKF